MTNMIESKRWTKVLAFAWLGTMGCRSEPVGDDELGETDESTDTDTDTDTGEELAPTYWQDVAPIYFDNCVTCHREGGAGPFVLDDYETAAAWAPATAPSSSSPPTRPASSAPAEVHWDALARGRTLGREIEG